MMENILEVHQLCKDEILNRISFTVKKGEMTAIMGPSGSGKSTLLYQLSGMDNASSGEVLLNGTSLCGLSEDKKAGLRLKKMGFVFQQMNMLRDLSIGDNILFPAYQISRTRAEKEKANQRAQALMEKMGISELAKRGITEVSGGQLQRACICRSMMNDPKILFADEPTGALNQRAAREIMEELQKLNQEETTILMVTHDSKVASRCERIIYLLDGEIKGELHLGKWREGQEGEREGKTGSWLGTLGW